MGKVGTARPYEPSPGVRSQLDGLPELGSPDFWDRVGEPNQRGPRWLDAEVLVNTLRRFLLVGNVDAAQRIGIVLVERWGKFVLRQSWCSFPDSHDYQCEFREEVHTRLWEHVFDPAETFWEANFIHALRGICFDVAGKLQKRKDHEFPLPVGHGDDGQAVDEVPDIVDPNQQDFDLQLLSAEAKERVTRALIQLPPLIRKAIFLRHIKGWQVASDDPTVMTISRALGVTDRTVRTYLRQGETMLRAWYEKEQLDGRA